MSKRSNSSRRWRRADGLFPGLKSSKPVRARRVQKQVPVNDDLETKPVHQSNPFGNDFAERIELDPDFAKQIFTIPRSIEIPSCYESVDHIREAMRRAWGVEWGNYEAHTVDIVLPYDFGVDQSKEGRVQIWSNYGVRATWDRSPDAKVRLLTRYFVDQKFHPKDNHCQLVVRDRQMDNTILHWSYWYLQSGESHPQWAEMHEWLAEYCPEHADPLLHWEDCEERNEQWLARA